jgi:hypothetical protein
VIPLDATLVKGSHGLHARKPEDRPVLIADGPAPAPGTTIPLPDVHRLLLQAMMLE